MKKTILSFFLLLMEASVSAQSKYDVNGDGRVTIADVTHLVNVLLGKVPTNIDEHEYVDLGLPSGTLWATCNIGASMPEECGDYFAWGETVPYGKVDKGNDKNYTATESFLKIKFSWSTYKYCNGSSSSLTKYCNMSDYGNEGFTDDMMELLPEDDAAYVNWGSSWRMPTYDQQTELREKCTWHWTTRNDVHGQEAVGPNGNSIFFPITGFFYVDSNVNSDYLGSLWSRSFNSSTPYCAFYLGIYTESVFWGSDARCYGRNVRPVRNQ